MTIDNFEPQSWLELQEHLFAEHFPSHAGPFHSHLIHRGMVDARWKLETSLERHGLVERERDLLRNFKKYSQIPGIQPIDDWEWLTIGQHHGLPTRFLDWTYSPLVALHFATDEANLKYKTPGVVWSIDYVRIHERLPKAVKNLLEKSNAPTFTTTALADGIEGPARLSELEDGQPFMLVLEPPSLDARVVNQYAGLSIMSTPDADLIKWLDEFPDPVAIRTIVPTWMKPEVREKLDKSNINERVVFPGPDGLATWLRRYYKTGLRSDWPAGPPA